MTKADMMSMVESLCNHVNTLGYKVTPKPYFAQGKFSYVLIVDVKRNGKILTHTLDAYMGTKEQCYYFVRSEILDMFLCPDIYKYEIEEK